MLRIRTLIADDEPLAREGIRRILEREPALSVIGECENGQETVDAVRRDPPDLLFLDIQMPGLDGFQVLESLDRTQLPLVVFVTAYEEHAVHAFEIHALDYVLKPPDESRVHEAVVRACGVLEQKEKDAAVARMLEMLGTMKAPRQATARLMVPSRGKITFVKVEEIDWIEAQGDYVQIYSAGKKFLLRRKVSALEQELPEETFARIHRSTIVNVTRVRELQPMYHGDYAVILQDGTRLTMSRSYRPKVFHDML
jgi:two-component system, LytTR family, response regulator